MKANLACRKNPMKKNKKNRFAAKILLKTAITPSKAFFLHAEPFFPTCYTDISENNCFSQADILINKKTPDRTFSDDSHRQGPWGGSLRKRSEQPHTIFRLWAVRINLS